MMKVIKNTIMLSSLKDLNRFLLTGNNINNTLNIFSNNIVFNHEQSENSESIRIWNTKSLFHYWINGLQYSNFVGALDYTIKNDHIKIEYLNLNADESSVKYNLKLDDHESDELTKSMIEYIKNLATKKEKKKIIIDVHGNLIIYNKYYKKHGFIATNKISSDNPFWIEAQLNL